MPEDPFTDSTNLSIRLIRHKIEEDDKITIKKVKENLYILYYTHSTKKDHKQIAVLDKEQGKSYIDNLFFILSQDITAFRFIQLNIPCMPLLLVPVQQLKKKRMRTILQTISKTLYF
jgi:hypothetical protein